jgi:hypothetical protein
MNEPRRIGTFESSGTVAERAVRKAGDGPTDPWAWWKAALANPKAIGVTLKMTTTPEQGFYRWKKKDSPWILVAIWQDEDGSWLAKRGAQHEERMVDAHQEWEYCRNRPITVDEYDKVYAGGEWSDVDSVVHAQRQPPRPGSNEPVDEAEILKDQIDSAVAGAKAYEKVDSDAKAALAQSLRSRLLELFREGDKKFHSEKDPITKLGKEIDERWRFRGEAETVAGKIRMALEKYESAKLARRRAEEEAARKAANEAERKREEAELSFVQQELAPEPAPAPPPAAAPETTIKGSYGRAATISTEWVVTGIADQDALYRYMREHADLKECLRNLAQRATKAGHDVPGITKSEQARVR